MLFVDTSTENEWITKVVETLQAGKEYDITSKKGYNMDFTSIALSKSQDQSNSVSLYLYKNEQETLICTLSEKLDLYQTRTLLEVVQEEHMILRVKGKGSITLSGFTYRCDLHKQN